MGRDGDAPARVARRHLLRAGGLAAAGAGVGAVIRPGIAGAAGYGFTPVDPYRAYDTRNGDGKIYFEQDYATTIWDDQHGTPRIPSGVAAVAYTSRSPTPMAPDISASIPAMGPTAARPASTGSSPA